MLFLEFLEFVCKVEDSPRIGELVVKTSDQDQEGRSLLSWCQDVKPRSVKFAKYAGEYGYRRLVRTECMLLPGLILML